MKHQLAIFDRQQESQKKSDLEMISVSPPPLLVNY